MLKPMLRLELCPLIAASLIFVGCSEEQRSVEKVVPRVKYFVVGEKATGQSRRMSGKLVAADVSRLSFAIGGTVKEVLVNQGDVVRQGQVLARLDTEKLRLAVEQARAKLNTARAKDVETKQAYDRAVTLMEKQAGSQVDVERTTSAHAAARGDVRSARSDLKRKERDQRNATLAAPFSGTIASRSIDPFQEVAAAAEAFVLQSADALEVEVSMPETLIRDVDHGQIVQVTFPTMSGTSVSGTVSQIATQAEAGNAFAVTVQLSPTDVDLRPGMTASVTFNFDAYLDGRTAYLIPLSAIAIEVGMLRQARGQQRDPVPRMAPVFVIGKRSELEVRDVVIGDLRGNQLEVFAGLEAGDHVVTAGVALLRAGMKVEAWSSAQGLTGG